MDRKGAINSVLLSQEKIVQQPIYFINHLLKEVEGRYTTLEKLALALVLTTHRLCPYFLSHPLTILTNSILGCVLTNFEAFGRLIKRTTEFSEYDL